MGTEVLNELQNAVGRLAAGARRCSTPRPTSADPGDDGVVLPRGPVTVAFRPGVGFAYPGG